MIFILIFYKNSLKLLMVPKDSPFLRYFNLYWWKSLQGLKPKAAFGFDKLCLLVLGYAT